MAKAYRTDVIAQKRVQDVIQTLTEALLPERVGCPVNGCKCSYQMYGYMLEDQETNLSLLLETLRREHPEHTNEMIVLNEPT